MLLLALQSAEEEGMNELLFKTITKIINNNDKNTFNLKPIAFRYTNDCQKHQVSLLFPSSL